MDKQQLNDLYFALIDMKREAIAQKDHFMTDRFDKMVRSLYDIMMETGDREAGWTPHMPDKMRMEHS